MRKTQWQRQAEANTYIKAEAVERLRKLCQGAESVRVGDAVKWIDTDGFYAGGLVTALGDQAASVQVTWREQGQVSQGRDMRLDVQSVAYDRFES